MPTPTEPTNAIRRQRARKALTYYKRKCLGERGPLDESTLNDLLADLLHLGDVSVDFNFEENLAAARRNHEAEVSSQI